MGWQRWQRKSASVEDGLHASVRFGKHDPKFVAPSPSSRNETDLATASKTHTSARCKKEGENLCDDRDDTTVGLDLGLGAARDVAGLDDDRVLGETALGEDLAEALQVHSIC